MSRYKFKVGQSVTLTPDRSEWHVPGGTYTFRKPLELSSFLELSLTPSVG